MTTYTPRPHEDYIKFVDGEIAKRKRIFEGLVRPIPDKLNSYHDVGIASLLANRDTLERHKADKENLCSECTHWGINLDDWELVIFPCPSYTDTTKHLDRVMGERNE